MVERDLAKVEVAGSIPVIRSRNADTKVWSNRVRKLIAIREAEGLSVDIRRGSRNKRYAPTPEEYGAIAKR